MFLHAGASKVPQNKVPWRRIANCSLVYRLFHHVFLECSLLLGLSRLLFAPCHSHSPHRVLNEPAHAAVLSTVFFFFRSAMSATASDKHLQQLSAGLHTFLKGQALTDVNFVVGDQTFSAHRLVLTAASPYFKTMLLSTFAEAETSEAIKISDISPDAFRALLGFIYTGIVDTLTPDNVCEILGTADRVCMEVMIAYCIEYLLEVRGGDERWCERLRVSDQCERESARE